MIRKQRILLVHNYYKIPGGEDTVIENERRLLGNHGHEVILYTRSNSEMDSLSKVGKLCLPFMTLFSVKTYNDVKKLIIQYKIDVVHVHNTLSLVSPSVYYAAFSCGVPVVQTVHNFRMLCPAATFVRNGKVCEECLEHGLACAIRYGCYRNSRMQTFMSAAILKIHRILGTYKKLYYICLTEFNKEKLLLLNKKGKEFVREERIFIKPNFVWRFEKEKVIKKKGYIYIGRLEKLKGIRLLLEAWRELPEAPLILCGSGPEEEWVKSYLEENHMEQVKLMGQLSHEEVMRHLAESKALILPTLCYEGQPMVILESYAAGTPVLASDLGNAGNMVIPEVTGFRFAPGDPAAIREAVKKMEQTESWDTQSVYERFYTPEKNYEILKNIYDRVGKD